MPEPLPDVVALLDLAESASDERLRRRSLDRLAGAIADAPARKVDALRGTSAVVERFLDRLCHAGIPAAPRSLDPGAVELGRGLVRLDADSLHRIADDLGVVESALLIRSLDRPASGEIVRSLESGRDRLETLAKFAPVATPDRVAGSLRRFSMLSRRGFAGSALTSALGRSLVATLLSLAEPDVAATIAIRLPMAAVEESTIDTAWLPVATAVVAQCRS